MSFHEKEAKSDRLLGWKESELMLRRKNDPDKMAIAVRMRRETTLSIRDIAARVHLGTSNTANARLHRAMKGVRLAGTTKGPMGYECKTKQYMG